VPCCRGLSQPTTSTHKPGARALTGLEKSTRVPSWLRKLDFAMETCELSEGINGVFAPSAHTGIDHVETDSRIKTANQLVPTRKRPHSRAHITRPQIHHPAFASPPPPGLMPVDLSIQFHVRAFRDMTLHRSMDAAIAGRRKAVVGLSFVCRVGSRRSASNLLPLYLPTLAELSQ